eukprot:CAMPEP_0201612960 /NCGR_PEP_ID=MMETSP0492-20130828/24592_1 /ASSEMBLY_ACC=CAM_ASM_000837 /TAXON_ID=420259 /ORGANISM="Thalassiosira gravida, Strain GMp14c1" /LENGTH=158 /DNA_ID=CAMNT_0048079671 /DNA_START=355 /DNA_END=827 /DNA_ORIENTATION=+
MAPRIPKKLGGRKSNSREVKRDSFGDGDGAVISSSPSTSRTKFSIKKTSSSSDLLSSSAENNHALPGESPSGGNHVKTLRRKTHVPSPPQPFETSEGAMRLNRILDSSTSGTSLPVGGRTSGSSPMISQRASSDSISKSKGGRKSMSLMDPSQPTSPG